MVKLSISLFVLTILLFFIKRSMDAIKRSMDVIKRRMDASTISLFMATISMAEASIVIFFIKRSMDVIKRSMDETKRRMDFVYLLMSGIISNHLILLIYPRQLTISILLLSLFFSSHLVYQYPIFLHNFFTFKYYISISE